MAGMTLPGCCPWHQKCFFKPLRCHVFSHEFQGLDMLLLRPRPRFEPH